MRTKRLFGIVMALALLMFALTACGSSNPSASASSAEKETPAELPQTEETSGSEAAETSGSEVTERSGSEAAETFGNETTETSGSEAAETDGSETTETAGSEATEELEEAGAAEPDTEDTAANDGKILIAYFSHTGNTEEVAQVIADYTGGDLAEIQRAEEYGDLEEEAEAEILEGIHPEIIVSVDNIEEYDTVFVGYPIWWDEAPAMIATFLADHDFSGKTVIPFCTSASDDIGNSLHIFSELCPDAEIAEGLTANELDDIEPWIQRLGLIS